jgi:hypothetical protein
MKKSFLTFGLAIVSVAVFGATTQIKTDPDKPATVETMSGNVVKTGKWLGDVQFTWKYDTHWSKGFGGSVENRNGESGAKGIAFVHGDIYTIDGNGIATGGNYFYEGHGPDPTTDNYGGNPLPDDRLGWQVSVPMLKGGLVDGADTDYGWEWPSNWTTIYYENDSADCTVILHTGGKSSIQRQNLFVIGGSATQITYPVDYGSGGDDIDDVGSWSEGDFTASSNVPPTSIQVPGVGKSLGSDGNLYCGLPDNADIDVTLQAPVAYYSFSVGATKYKLTLTANSIDLTTNTPEFCVGQNVTFILHGLPVAYITDMVGNWQLPGTFVNYSFQDSPPDGSENYYTHSDLLQNTNQTSCWFVNGTGGAVGMNLNLHFNNGQYASVAAVGNISIYRPSFSDFTQETYDLAWSFPSMTADMFWKVTVHSKYDGQYGITQLLLGTGIYYGTSGEYVLDGDSEIYGDATNGPSTYTASDSNTHVLNFQDSPTAPTTSMDLDFEDYLRFKPSGDNSIFVTIGKNGWSVDASYNPITGVFTPSNISPATRPVDSDEFPRWDTLRPGH